MAIVKRANPIAHAQRSFGFHPVDSRHHFLITIAKSSKDSIEISEHLTWDESRGSSPVSLGNEADGQIRVVLARPKWDAIADEVRSEFNRRLKREGRRAGSWRAGPNVIRRELGKELVLLTWAIEDADPGLVPTAIANWLGLVPEERWWMYTQTAAATGHGLRDRNKGWRKAVRFALTENPVSMVAKDEAIVPDFFRIAADKAKEQPLFDFTGDQQPNE